MDKFITAKEAINISENSNIEKLKNELTPIYDRITKEAKFGNVEVYWCAQISNVALLYLQNSGFNVETYNENSDSIYNIINWT